MTNLKDKLSASVRQAKASIQPVAKPVTKAVAKPVTEPVAKAVARAAKSSRAQAPVHASPTAAVKPRAMQSSGVKPMPAQIPQPSASGGFVFPDRVWPD